MRSTREAFGNALLEIGEDPRVVALDTDVATSVFTHKFAEKYPERYFQLGIAESNMIGVAAGLASAGKIPFCASFAAFVANRFETIRMSVAYNRSNVRIVGTHVGVGIGPDGHSQMGLEDVALMRTLPNMAVLQPATANETESMVHYLVDHIGPAYLRCTRQALPELFSEGETFELGKGRVIIDGGTDIAFVATGACVHEAIKASEILNSQGIKSSVSSISSIQPIDHSLLTQLAQSHECIVSVEDHVSVGGLGGAVCESLAERHPKPVLRIGVEGFGESGDPDELYEHFGLSGAKVAQRAESFLRDRALASL